MKTGNIRILRSGLTVGSSVYRPGDIVPPAQQTHDLCQLADGKLHVGHVWAEWETAPDPAPQPQHIDVSEPVTQVATHEEQAEVVNHVEPASEPATAPEAAGKSSDLTEAVKAAVISGLGKRKVMEQLGASEAYTQKQVGDEFDRLVAIGVIVQGDHPGKYAVV